MQRFSRRTRCPDCHQVFYLAPLPGGQQWRGRCPRCGKCWIARQYKLLGHYGWHFGADGAHSAVETTSKRRLR